MSPTESLGIASHHRFPRWRPAAYWLATSAVAAELGIGGTWDVTRLPSIRDTVAHLGYPSYFLVLLGTWKVLAAAALLVPRRALLKEWAYAGAFFTYTGAIVSHLATGYALGEVAVLAPITALTVLSWALRPPSRRTPRPAPGMPLAATAGVTPGAGRAIPVPGHAATGSSEASGSAA
jgi:DoxX-like protein